jgi:hypothetical protein
MTLAWTKHGHRHEHEHGHGHCARQSQENVMNARRGIRLFHVVVNQT